jgi:hypothetical protein
VIITAVAFLATGTSTEAASDKLRLSIAEGRKTIVMMLRKNDVKRIKIYGSLPIDVGTGLGSGAGVPGRMTGIPIRSLFAAASVPAGSGRPVAAAKGPTEDA